MSSGHHGSHGPAPSEIKRAAAMAAIAKRLKAPYTVDRSHHVPYLAGYSRDGKTIYIDADMPESFSYRGKTIHTDRFLILHERIEKALIDELDYGYWQAHRIAEAQEEDEEGSTGAPQAAFRKFYAPFIKADEHEKLVKVPADLDLTPYRAKPVDKALLRHLEAKTGKSPEKETKADAGYSQGTKAEHCGICAHYAAHECEIVAGRIFPAMWCRYFEKRAG